MINTLPLWDKAQADSHVGQEGQMVLDTSDVSLRVYNGQVVGGYKSEGLVKTKNQGGPGPNGLIAGDIITGYYGETAVEDLIEGRALAELVGLTSGYAFHYNEPWLKFSDNEKVIYISKSPYRTNVPFTNLQNINITYPGVEVTIGDNQYRVRLMRGADQNPAPATLDTATVAPEFEGFKLSDFYRFLLPLLTDSEFSDPRSNNIPRWGSLTLVDLGVVDSTGSWTYTEHLARAGDRIYWPFTTADRLGRNPPGNAKYWRPVLELIN